MSDQWVVEKSSAEDRPLPSELSRATQGDYDKFCADGKAKGEASRSDA